MFHELKQITARPAPYECYTADRLWTDPHISGKMLEYHLNEDTVLASRKPDYVAKSIAWLIQIFEIGEGVAVADFGCGPGLYAAPLAETGAEVTGIDFSENSIRYARRVASQKGLKIEYVNSNYLDFRSERRFDLIIMIYCDFSALNPEQRAELLSVFHEHLKDGGSVVLDVWSHRFFESVKEEQSYEYVEKDGFWTPAPHFVFSGVYAYPKENLYLGKFTIYEESRRWEIYNWLQCFTRDRLREEFSNAGFEIGEFFAGVAGESDHDESLEIAVVAKKRRN